VLANELIELDPQYHKVSAAARKDLTRAKEALVAQAPKGAAADPFEERLARRRRKGKQRDDSHQTELAAAAVADGKARSS
jgi:hypothetical protein